MRRACLIGLLLCSLRVASAQPVVLPRAKAPVSLLDGAHLDRWTGLKVAAATLEGQPAMQFTLPQYIQGANEWPAIYLNYDQGRGFALTDWSHHAVLSFDVRTDSEQAADLAIELRDKPNANGWTSHMPIAPGRTNHMTVVLSDLPHDFDLTHVIEIVFFATRPAATHTITIANLKLEPGDRPPLVELSLFWPNYRDLVFPDWNMVGVYAIPHLEEYGLRPEQLSYRIACRGGGKQRSDAGKLDQVGDELKLAVDNLPAGPLELTATVTAPGLAPLTLKRTLRKLTAAEVKSLKVYVDEDNNTIVDGQPFFPLGWYDNVNLDHLREIADSPFNCILAYGTNGKPKAEMRKYLDEVQRRGLKLIYSLNDVYPAAKYYEGKNWEGVTGNQAIAEAVVRAYRDHPALLAWYLNDELPKAMAPELTEYYQSIRSADRNHPCYIVLCDMSELAYFTGTTDIMGVDPYPIPTSPVTKVSDWMDAATMATMNTMPTWLVPQAFAWYQHQPPGSDRARFPSEEDLRTGRAPTYEEGRCMTYLALVHGAKGLVYWCYYNMRVLPQYQEMWGWMKQIAAEVKALSPVLLAGQGFLPGSFEQVKGPIHAGIWGANPADGYRQTLIAVNTSREPATITYDLLHLPPEVTDPFTKESVATDGKHLKLSFKPLEVHVLDLGPVGR